jgi:two-component system KDP operon response regulator KdpE
MPTMLRTVLLIDADEDERRVVGSALRDAGASVVEVATGSQGLLQVLDLAPDVVVLAEEVPPLQGRELLTVLRRLSDAPVVILGSGGGSEEPCALDLGADSYLRRPLRVGVLVARIRALLRRYRPSLVTDDEPLCQDVLPVCLTKTERRLLACLTAHAGRTVSQQELLLEVWGGRTSLATVRFYLRRLRHKLEEVPCGLKILNLRGIGPRLVQPEIRADGMAQAG